ncbi:RICIN domain-containing protein [Streptomyces sp. NBC_01261]|uniref:RICIN domain-containing protein n=1 Tax=Streptomyces sp. NBC_01261 TaxID=2903802 RepID=UPI002E36E36F|nr:ricin-type beta-trefoil lectin domain protein [Streptomyces sp. NBC_01261]
MFRSEDLPPADRLAAFDTFLPARDPPMRVTSTAPDRFRDTARTRDLGPVHILEPTCSPSALRRTTRLIHRSDPARQAVDQDDRSTSNSPKEVAVKKPPSCRSQRPRTGSSRTPGFGTCLTAGDTGTAFATSCVGSNRQQWDFVGASGSFAQVRNRETGTCLTTDNKTTVNAVWMSTCSGATGQWWWYQGDSGHFFDDLGSAGEGYPRTSTVKDAVYATDNNQSPIPSSYYVWYGTHN